MATTIISNPPVAEQIFSILFERILKGEYSPGEQLPSESDIASELKVSRASVRTALARLEASGQISRRHGEGTFVSKRIPNQNILISIIWEFSNLIKENGQVPRIEVASSETRLASDDEKKVLDLMDPNEQVLDIVRIFYADREPVIYTKNIIPSKLINTDPDNIDGTKQISQILLEYCDKEIAYIDSNISGNGGNIAIDQLLKIKECTPLLRLEEVFFSSPDERPILLSDSYLNTMKIRLHRIRPWGWVH
jgi:GntR family transcriptional regulator